jgi:hypothetical protein
MVRRKGCVEECDWEEHAGFGLEEVMVEIQGTLEEKRSEIEGGEYELIVVSFLAAAAYCIAPSTNRMMI